MTTSIIAAILTAILIAILCLWYKSDTIEKTTYEYTRTSIDSGEISAILNEYGADGWELCYAYHVAKYNYYVCILKKANTKKRMK